MNKIRRAIMSIYHIATVFTIGFITLKVARYWHSTAAEKKGHAIDASIGAAAEKLEKTAIALKVLSDKGTGENLGKGMDGVLTDTKKSLEKATHLVKRALKH